MHVSETNELLEYKECENYVCIVVNDYFLILSITITWCNTRLDLLWNFESIQVLIIWINKYSGNVFRIKISKFIFQSNQSTDSFWCLIWQSQVNSIIKYDFDVLSLIRFPTKTNTTFPSCVNDKRKKSDLHRESMIDN